MLEVNPFTFRITLVQRTTPPQRTLAQPTGLTSQLTSWEAQLKLMGEISSFDYNRVKVWFKGRD